jgi:hypothetical protein
VKTDTYIPSFKSALSTSVLASLAQFPALAVNAVLLFALLAVELVLPVSIFWLSSQTAYELPLRIVSSVWMVYLFLSYNGALGYLFGVIPTNGDFTQTWTARKRGLSFMVSSLKVGVLLLFGQLFLVCLCFLLMKNYIVSPYLFIYENLSGKAAEQRSVELARGFGWDLLSRTALLLIFAYASLILVVIVGYSTQSIYIYVLMALAFLFIGLVQSNIIFSLYNVLRSIPEEARGQQKPMSYRFAVVSLIFIAAAIYGTIKVLPGI